MNRIEPFWELAQHDPLVRWTAIVGALLVWLAVAWTDPLPLMILGVIAGSLYLFRRRRPLEPRDDELDVL